MRVFQVLLLAGLLTVGAWAKDVQLFVKNQPFDGTTRLVGKELFAPLDDLLTSLGCSWQLGANALLQVQSVTERKTPPGPPLDSVASLSFDGRPVHVNQHLYAGRVFVDVRQFARAMGSPFRLNLGAGTADLYAPLAAGGREEAVRSNGDGRTSPLLLDKLSYALEPEQGRTLMRGYAVVKNQGAQPLRGVVVRVKVVDESGRVVGRLAESLGTLAAGQQATWQFPLWADYEAGARKLRPQVELEHLP